MSHNLTPSKICFRPVRLCDKTAIDALLARSKAPMCDHAFANLYAWQPVYHTIWAEVCDALVVGFDLSGEGNFGYMIVGAERADAKFESLTIYSVFTQT